LPNSSSQLLSLLSIWGRPLTFVFSQVRRLPTRGPPPSLEMWDLFRPPASRALARG